MTSRDADYFDQWYDDMTRSEVRDGLFESVLGLPPHLLSTSLLTWSGIDSVVAALAVSGGDVLLDLACGRGCSASTSRPSPWSRRGGVLVSSAWTRRSRSASWSGPDWRTTRSMP
jgi:hypothetical protein